MDQEAIIIAITGSESARHRAMVDLEKEIYKLRDVAAVTNIGDPGRQVTVALRRERLAASGAERRSGSGPDTAREPAPWRWQPR